MLLYSEFKILNILCESYQDIGMAYLPTINIYRGQMHRMENEEIPLNFIPINNTQILKVYLSGCPEHQGPEQQRIFQAEVGKHCESVKLL